MSLKRKWGASTPSSTSAQQTGTVQDCTTECRAKEHALLVLSSAYLGNLKLLKHCSSVCANSLHIQDALGRNALHIATSKGHLQLVHWLVARKKVKVDVTDLESNWTALHRCAYYGQLGAAAVLLKGGADVKVLDNDGWSPLDVLNADRESLKHTLTVDGLNVYTWGRNPNDTLGHDRSRKYPEKLDFTLAPNDAITKVVLCKFHSVFLTQEGRVLSCGHGPGGRLGHETEQSIATPRVLKAMEGLVCVGVAAARDHTVILTNRGSVYTCGLNDAHQLGHGSNPTNAPSNYLAPKLVRGLKNKLVIAVGAGRYHTAMCTQTELYTVGRNLGQLGYEKTHDTQVAPHAVAGINLDSDVMTHMSVSDSATAVLTRKHHVFVCTGFIVKRIRLGFLDKVRCLQFEVCASLSDRDYLRKVETEPTKVLVLDSEHKLWVWEPTRRGGYPTIIHGFAKRNVTQFSLGKSLTIVTKEGEIFRGNASVGKPLDLQRIPGIQNAQAVFTDFKANNFAYIQNVYGSPFLPVLSQSTLTSDLSFLLEEPGSVSDMEIEVGDQTFAAHKFILSSQAKDFMSQLVPVESLSDLSSFKLQKKCDNPDVFDAFLHYIYGSHIRLVPPSNGHSHPVSPCPSHALTNGMGSDSTTPWDGTESTPDTSFASVDENDLTEEYDKYCVNTDELQEEWIEIESLQPPIVQGQSTPRKKSRSLSARSRSRNGSIEDCENSWAEPEKVLQLGNRRLDVKSLLQLATNFDLKHLQKALEEIVSHLYKPRTIVRPRLRLRRQREFSDLSLVSREGKAIHCHRCVLVARSEYFRSMLLMGWKESSDDLTSLSMPVGYEVLEAVIDYMYTDEIQVIEGGGMVERLMAVLVMADQLLLTRLKELCEYALAKILNLKNAVEFLEFAEAYSALQLKKACLQFICVNGAHFLEAGSLVGLELSLLEALSTVYQDLILPNTKRIIKFPEPAFELLPKSYFHDDGEEGMDSGAGESEGEDKQSTPTPEIPDTSVHAANSSTISPRAVSNSRRKRKRKTSQSEKKQGRSSKSPPPISPVEEKSITLLRANPSPANPASPDSITSPCSPISALASDWTPRPSGGTGSSNMPNRSTSSPTPWISIEKKRKNSNAFDSSVTVNPKDSDANDEESVLKSKANSVPHQGDGQRHPGTPLSVPEKTLSYKKMKKSEMRTRLMNKFNAMTGDSETPETSRKTAQKASGPWGCIDNGSKDISGAKSLRDIMAKEEEIQQKIKQHSKSHSPPPSLPPLGQNDHDNGANHARKSQPIPVLKNLQKENSMPSPSSISPSSNPWKTPESSSPAVSMRALIAEAEAKDKHTKLQALANRPIKKVPEERPTKRQPVVQPHQQVSFASIIKSQECERNRNRSPQKALSLIQIEERAISDLEKAYCATDNPDEVIVVERHRKDSRQVDHGRSVGPVNSPWAL